MEGRGKKRIKGKKEKMERKEGKLLKGRRKTQNGRGKVPYENEQRGFFFLFFFFFLLVTFNFETNEICFIFLGVYQNGHFYGKNGKFSNLAHL